MNDKRKQILLKVLSVLIVSMVCIVGYFWFEGSNYVQTEDARVYGDIAKIASQISGKIVDIDMEEGQRVYKDQILGRVEMINQPDSSTELSLLRAPIDGVVLKKQGLVGEVASPSQALGMMVDPSKLYVIANIEETKINRVHVGQKVTFAIDQFDGTKFEGKVITIGQATNSTFSLMPSSSSGSFTKVIQKIPVKISIEGHHVNLLPGANTTVKIHIR